MNHSRSDIIINCGKLRLEGILELPGQWQTQVPGAVICHPHPLYGGSMHNNVTNALKSAFLERGIAALRFNFRGVGRSQGRHGNGIDEIEDVCAAIDYLASAPDVDPQRLILAGYSFGCWVGLRAARNDLRLVRLVGVSPPLDVYDFGFIQSEPRPKLFLAGDRDFVCSLSAFNKFAEDLQPPKMTSICKGADHFHMGSEGDIISLVHSFLDTYPVNDAA